MTAAELTAECNYIHDERLAILCGTNEPTPEQRQIALREAQEHERKMRDENT